MNNPLDNKASPYQWPVLICLLFALVLGAANLIFGELNQDEGWYLYAAQLVKQGFQPYLDFAFTQGPMMPAVYSWFDHVVYRYGVGGGRYITSLMGLFAAFLFSRAAHRIGGSAAAVITFALAVVNVYQSYFTTVVKTYSLSALFLSVAFYALARLADKRDIRWPLLAGIFLAAAAGTRLSLGILLPVVGLWLLAYRGRWGKLSWFWFGCGGAAALCLIFMPHYLRAPEGFRFGLIEFHTLRESGSVLSGLIYKGGFISRIVQAYFVAFVLLVVLAAAKVWRPFKGNCTGYHDTTQFNLIRLVMVSFVAATLVHLSAPFPYDDYQVPVYPLLALALGVSWSYALRAWSGMGYRWQEGVAPVDPPATRWFVWSLIAILAAASFSSPLNQEWMIAGRDRIWWKMKEEPALIQLRELARELKSMAPHGILLTQDTYLAVEAALEIPMGWEMGPFSLYPHLTNEQAKKMKLRNVDLMIEDIENTCAEVAAISGYGLSIASPDVSPLDEPSRARLLAALNEHYEHVKSVPSFGQASTTLEIYRRKSHSSEPHHH